MLDGGDAAARVDGKVGGRLEVVGREGVFDALSQRGGEAVFELVEDGDCAGCGGVGGPVED